MSKPTASPLLFALCATLTACNASRSISTQPAPPWPTFNDPAHYFHFQYPPTWKVNAEHTTRAHYTLVLAALNSAGKENFTVHEIQTGPSTYELNPNIITQLVPAGTAYLDISWQEGPPGPPPQASELHEMEAADLSPLLTHFEEEHVGPLTTRGVSFNKWGKTWSITLYIHTPVEPTLRADIDKILTSFQFEKTPPRNHSK